MLWAVTSAWTSCCTAFWDAGQQMQLPRASWCPNLPRRCAVHKWNEMLWSAWGLYFCQATVATLGTSGQDGFVETSQLYDIQNQWRCNLQALLVLANWFLKPVHSSLHGKEAEGGTSGLLDCQVITNPIWITVYHILRYIGRQGSHGSIIYPTSCIKKKTGSSVSLHIHGLKKICVL